LERKSTVAMDGTPKDCNNRRNRVQPSKIKKKTANISAAFRLFKHLALFPLCGCTCYVTVSVAAAEMSLLRGT
jgi:hypothetical protein